MHILVGTSKMRRKWAKDILGISALFLTMVYQLLSSVGVKDPPVLKTDTQETEKILKRQFLLIKRVQAYIHSS
jgi:hypothetical protein